ncbi:MAG: hypothetical protein IJY12_02505 [Clostridia bacterium]|nr:hypothetical protein [Clostridia bacterium]
MSKKIKIFLTFFVILSLLATAVIFAAGSTYDSSSDPLVSLSFLTEIFKPELQNEIREANDNVELVLQAQIDSLTAQIADQSDKIALLTEKLEKVSATLPSTPSASESGAASHQVYVVLELKKGDVLIAEEVSELVLRSGEAIVMTPSVNKSLLDCTDGQELTSGQSVPVNHFILIPGEADGRGITVTSDTASVMIKGAYSLVEK